MKKKILGIVMPIIGAIICGYICGKCVYFIYNDSLHSTISSSRLFLVENGKYDSIDEMKEANNKNNYVYYLDDEGYKTVVGITGNYKNVDKIRKIYSDGLSYHEYYMPKELVDNRQIEYDKELSELDSVYDIKEVVDNIINLYKKDDSIKLTLIN